MAGKRAIVIGASIAGLLAATALRDQVDGVTLVERDELGDGAGTRRGVPQGNQIHQLMALGLEKIEELVPGFGDDLVAAGCERYDAASGLAFWTPLGWSVRAHGDIPVFGFTRPLFEALLRRRVLSAGGIAVAQGQVAGLLAGADQKSVAGVRLGDGRVLAADLVVDATGRGSRAGSWLTDIGFDKPAEQRLDAYMGYVTTIVRLPGDALPDGVRGLVVPPHPGNTKGGAVMPCGNGNHVLAAVGMARDYPPTELAPMLDFLEQAANPLLGRTMRRAAVVEDPVGYRMAGSRRRLWEQLERRPEGFVVVGDAVASFNPLYGQGMTMAALGATVLRDVVGKSDGVTGIAAQAAEGLAPWVDIAFGMAASQDAFYEGAEFVNLDRLPIGVAESGAVAAAVATEDVEVMIAMRRAAYYMDPAAVAAPSVQATLDKWAATGRRPGAQALDAERIPGVVSPVP